MRILTGIWYAQCAYTYSSIYVIYILIGMRIICVNEEVDVNIVNNKRSNKL